MAVTVADIANSLGISVERSLELLDAHGIFVSNPSIPLSPEQLKKINDAIQQAKAGQASGNSEAQNRAISNLEYYITNYKIFIDTCSILHFMAGRFWESAAPLLSNTGNKIIIPTRVMDELEKHQNNTTDKELADKAQAAIKSIVKLEQQGLIERRGEKSDNFADNVFAVVFTKFRLTHKLLLITQDTALANDILNLNKIKSVRANDVVVKRINKYGFLSNFDFDKNKNSVKNTDRKFRMPNASRTKESEVIDKFNLSKSVTNVSADLLKVSSIPVEGNTVYTSNGPIQLVKSIASGGEGSVFTTNTPYVAKIYKREKINKVKYEKIKLMLSKKVNCSGVCWPVDIIYNKEKEFVGYLMPKAEGKELQKCLFVKPLLLKNFPKWKKRDTVELCLTILQKIQYLHERNIILGDINPMNILVVSSKEVYLVDTDSYQIEGFPCPVGTINYTAPEIQRKNFASFLRSFGNEYFAVATLLFMIMLPGKPPYSQQGGENPVDNIIKMDFSYPFGEQSNKKTPDGPWRYIWSHMTYDVKEAFYKSFRKGEEHSTENTRLTPDEWISKLSYYLQLLDSGKFAKQDEMSEELFPTRFKKIAGMTYIKCNLCNKEVAEEQLKNGICRECLNKGELYKCSRCGKEILFSNYQKYIKNSKKHDTCSDCFDYLSKTHSNIRCVDCGRVFEFSNREYEFYTSKGLSIPKRCSSCKSNKTNYTPRQQTPSYRSSSNSNRNSNKSSSGGFCFVTTAVCDYFNKPDDCYELTMFRKFRDNWLLGQPDGESIVHEYYQIAPTIVERIDNSLIKNIIYKELWDDYLSICLSLIEHKKYHECKNLYKSMVEYLKSIFIYH